MHSIITEKVPGGKLLRVKVDFDEVISRIQITGDFFLHPEEKITALEQGLAGVPVREDAEQLAARIRQLVEANGITLVGFAPEDLARLVAGAVQVKQ